MEVVNSAQKRHTLPQTTYSSTISVIPKPGRECNRPSDFRPIPNIIHHNQTGFIQNRDLKTNTRTCLSLVQYAKKYNKDQTLRRLSIDLKDLICTKC